jgi:hypothetical protein
MVAATLQVAGISLNRCMSQRDLVYVGHMLEHSEDARSQPLPLRQMTTAAHPFKRETAVQTLSAIITFAKL